MNPPPTWPQLHAAGVPRPRTTIPDYLGAFYLHMRQRDGDDPRLTWWWADERGKFGMSREEVPDGIADSLCQIEAVKWLVDAVTEITIGDDPHADLKDEPPIYVSLFGDKNLAGQGDTFDTALRAALAALPSIAAALAVRA